MISKKGGGLKNKTGSSSSFWLFLIKINTDMQVIHAYKPFEVQEIELDTWHQRPVKNNFFELVWIKEGKGTQCIDYNVYAYKEGSIFLLPP
ncbi:MAG: hypothetical protein AAF696_36825, partial [Bacteroidota bacterium]